MKDLREGGITTGVMGGPDSDGEIIAPLEDLKTLLKSITVERAVLPTKLKVSPGVIELFNGLS